MTRNPILLDDFLKTYFKYDAQTVIDIALQKVFENVSFSFSRRFSIGASGTVNIVIDPTAISAGKIVVVFPIAFKAVGAGPIFIDTYFGTDANNDGTVWQPRSRDQRTGTLSQTIARLSPTINSDGTKLDNSEFMIPSDGIAATTTIGGESKDDDIIIGRTDGKYMFRLINQDNTSAAQCLMVFNILELSEVI